MRLLQGRFSYYSIYIATLVAIVAYLLLFAWLTPYRVRMRIASLWPGFMAGTWLRIGGGVRVQVSGNTDLPKTPFIAVCNHQSEWETLYLARLLCPASVVMKESLLRIPVYGWGQRLTRPIAIDRSSPKASIRAILEQGAKRLGAGSNVLIFPEGTRVEAGNINKYGRAAFKLAAETGVPVIPMVHNSGNYWLTSGFKKGTIQLVIGDPIQTEGITAEELTKRVESWSHNIFASIKHT